MPEPSTIKPGYKTTEFWLTTLTNISAIVGSLNGLISPDLAAIIVAVANGIYGVVRAIAKKGANDGTTN